MSASCAIGRSRRGVALFAALSLLALLGLLVAGGFATSLLDRRSAGVARTDAELTTAADYALYTALAGWETYGLAELRVGETRSLAVNTGIYATRASVSATPLPSGMLWLLASVTRDGADGTRRGNLVARFPFVAYRPDAALTSNADVQIGADVHFSVDSTGDRGCAQIPISDVLLSPSAAINITDTTRTRITIARRASVADSTRYVLAIDSTTRRNNPHVIYIAGDTTLTDGSIDGVLIVTGRLRITGRFVFSGVVIAGRGIDATLGEPIVRGAVLAFGTPGTTVVQFARASLQFASCVAFRALQMAHAPRRVRERSWAEMY
jgi:hypothetical protein